MDIKEQFPTLLEFQQLTELSSAAAEKNNTIPFRELPTNQVFKIVGIKSVQVKERNAVIIELQDQAEVTTKVWATSVLTRNNLEEKRDELENKVLYIISKGKKISSNNLFYYDFAIKTI